MLTIIKCDGCGKALLEGDIYQFAGQLIVNVAPCGCRSNEIDCAECEDLEANKLKIAELTEQRDQAQRELASAQLSEGGPT